MNDFFFFLNKIFFYVKTFRLYEPLFIASVTLAAPASTFITSLIQKSATETLGSQNFVPMLSIELITFFLWIILSNILRNIFMFLDTQVLKVISRKPQEYNIDFTKSNAPEKISREWTTQGNVYFENGLNVTDTHSGILIKPRFLWLGRIWFNFEAIMEVNFQNMTALDTVRNKQNGEWVRYEDNKIRQLLGVIVRAQSLDDYYMLEIWKIDKDIVLKPHVRISGVWRAPIYTSPIAHKLSKDQSLVKLRLILKDRIASLYIDDDNNPLVWVLPSQYEIDLGKRNIYLKDGFVREISFNNRAGMFGFRNYGNELAIVKNLKIKSLN